jgi:hypothetical protein
MGQVAPESLAAPSMSIQSMQDLAKKRSQMIDFIWGDAGMPGTRVPDEIYRDIWEPQYDGMYNSIANLSRIDQYRIKLSYGFESIVYHFFPIHSNGKLFIYHAGHGYGFRAEDRSLNNGGEDPGLVIPALIKDGYSVLAFSMPLQGNPEPTDSVPGYGYIAWNMATSLGHDQMFKYLPHPFTYFFDPIAITLNYVEDHFNYQRIYMMGLSGGGWTTVFYSAIDERINFSFPVAGSVPLYLRVDQEGLGDAEQGYDYTGILSVANYTELYLMGASGEGRGQLQINNRYDDCCFYGNRDYLWTDSVKIALDNLRDKGHFSFFSDTTHFTHKVSIAALSQILTFINYYERNDGSPVISKPVFQKVCSESPTTLTIEARPNGLSYHWQVYQADGQGFVSLKDNDLYAGSLTGMLTISRIDTAMNNFAYRCIVSGDGIPVTTSYPFTLVVNAPVTLLSAPERADVCSGKFATFTVDASGAEVNFQWQESRGSDFADIDDDSKYSGYNEPALSIKDVSQAENGNLYRCLIAGCHDDKILTTPGLLRVHEPSIVAFNDLSDFYCHNDQQVKLNPYPEGGVFAGNGLVDDAFDPSSANLGADTVTYIFTNESGCITHLSKITSVIDCGVSPGIIQNAFVYPNPSGGFFKMGFHTTLSETRFDLTVISMMGEILITDTEQSAGGEVEFNVDLSKAASGLYMVVLTTDDTLIYSERLSIY